MQRLFIGIWTLLLTPIGLVLGLTIVWHLALWMLAIPIHLIPSLITFIIDIVIVQALFDRWVYFFAQFVLPVHTPAERREIYLRVKSGAGGPALFIRNGKAISREGEEKKRGSGVIMVDTASAAVLRTDTEIRETIGPGITFTSGEYLAGTVDLRKQFQTIGPVDGDRPFAANREEMTPEEYTEVQKRRKETTGLTRDGFEVVPSISIRFSVRKPETDYVQPGIRVHSEYGFNPDAVRNAIVRKLVHTGGNGNGDSHLLWNQLPAHLAINLWREYVRKFKFSELFTSSETSGLQTIEGMINRRMREAYVMQLDDTGIPTGVQIESPEAQHLSERGIQVEDVKIHCLLFDPSLEEKIIQAWETDWLGNARREQKQLEEWEALIDTSAREEAVQHFVELASRPFATKSRFSANPFITLQLLFQNLKDAVVTENSADAHLEQELRKMDDFSKWLKDNNATLAFGGRERQE